MGAVCLAWGNFNPGQPVPNDFPYRTGLAYAAAAFMIVAGASVELPRIRRQAAAALAVYFGLIVVIVMNGRVVLAHYTEFGSYSGLAEQLAIAASGLIIYVASADPDATRAARLTRLGQCTFGVCAMLFGGAHFVYMNLTAPLVPGWIPPSQEFWAYATGICQVAAGLAILVRVHAHLAAILLTAMYVSFTVLVHIPMLIANPHGYATWSENALNLALIGSAWVVADSLRSRPSTSL